VILRHFTPSLVLLLAFAGCATTGSRRAGDGTFPAAAAHATHDMAPTAEAHEAPERPTREMATHEPREVREVHIAIDRERACTRCR
jgi:hypothetical protein